MNSEGSEHLTITKGMLTKWRVAFEKFSINWPTDEEKDLRCIIKQISHRRSSLRLWLKETAEQEFRSIIKLWDKKEHFLRRKKSMKNRLPACLRNQLLVFLQLIRRRELLANNQKEGAHSISPWQRNRTGQFYTCNYYGKKERVRTHYTTYTISQSEGISYQIVEKLYAHFPFQTVVVLWVRKPIELNKTLQHDS